MNCAVKTCVSSADDRVRESYNAALPLFTTEQDAELQLWIHRNKDASLPSSAPGAPEPSPQTLCCSLEPHLRAPTLLAPLFSTLQKPPNEPCVQVCSLGKREV